MKASKDTPEKIARRERARRRREKAELAMKQKPTSEGVRKILKVQVDPPPPLLKVRKRMKTVVTQDNVLQTVMSDDPADAKIALCNEHYDKLLEKLKLHGIDHLISTSVEQLKARLQNKKIDPLFHATDALIRLSLNTIGSEGVVQYRCPVCALTKFDFISQIAQYMKSAAVQRTQ